MKKLKFILMAFFCFVFSCKQIDDEKIISKEIDKYEKIDKKIQIPSGNDTLIYYRYDCCFAVALYIRYPIEEPKGTILMLNPYNSFIDSWCILSDFCQEALSQSFVLIYPNFGNTVYAYDNYKETDLEKRKYPTLKWILEIMVIDIQNQFGLLKPGQNNFVTGLSMGGRGAILTAYYMKNVFKAAATISGFFNISEYSYQKSFISALGNYDCNPERWHEQCVLNFIDDYNIPTYIAHGQADNISQVYQSIKLYNTLKSIHKNIKFDGHFPRNESYGYNYWKKETYNILEFFNRFI